MFDPLWEALAWVLASVLLAIFLVLGPLLDRMMLALERMASGVEPVQSEMGPPMPIDYVGVERMLREWTVLRYCLVVGAVVAVLAVLWFFFVQSDEETQSPDSEEEEQIETRSGIRPGLPNLDRLRDWLNLLRRYGVSQKLLNAISVQNMYANLGRLARERGYPRMPSQPPDAYLPQLQQAFPGQADRLDRMTQAYMRVHYGDLSVEDEELDALREDYEHIKEAPAPTQTEA